MTNKNKLIILFATLFLTHSIYAVEVEEYAAIEVYGIYEVYECSIDTIYAMGHGESTDLHGGKLVITVTNDEVDVQSDRKGVDSGLLRLVVEQKLKSSQLMKPCNLHIRFMPISIHSLREMVIQDLEVVLGMQAGNC